ncbi:MAG: beta-lactamase hydrolase domain-containing protein [Candidatus Rariloculaceae bacterium]
MLPTKINLKSVAGSFLLACLFAFNASAQEVELRNRMDPEEGLTTSGQPDATAFEALADSGYTAVIDLRLASENHGLDEQATVEGLGMSYISIPVAGADGVNFENAGALDRFLAGIDGPVLVHCGSGNRAGALLALREKLNGADNEAALKYGREAGLTGLEPVVTERLDEVSTP